ncbi:MAG: hypothetical protein U0Y96_02825 [Candidatus Kapaibacterium sp.]
MKLILLPFMMNLKITELSRFIAIGVSLVLAGCSNVLYTPTLLSPIKSEKGSTEIIGSGAFLGKAIQRDLGKTEFGGVGGIRYTFTDKLSMQTKLWGNFNNKGGSSVDALFWRDTTKQNESFYSLSIGMAWAGNGEWPTSINGYAIGACYGKNFGISNTITGTCVAGILAGTDNIRNVPHGSYGVGVMVEPGVQWQCLSWLNVGVSVPTVMQYDVYNKRSDIVPMPLGLVRISL